MSQLTDWEIRALCEPEEGLSILPMIDPFLPELCRQIAVPDMGNGSLTKAISFGLSSYGYDVRLAPTECKMFRWLSKSGHTQDEINYLKHSRILAHGIDPDPIVADPKALDPRLLIDLKAQTDENGTFFILPAHSYVLAKTVEWFNMPPNVLMTCLGKSTNVRSGISANVTPGEPSWRGVITLELGNWLPVPVRLYCNEGIAQFIFWKGDRRPVTTYDSRAGKYQDQRGTTLPKV